ncbi:MAG TPA: hypothetical protein VG406_10760 [Isosphaeraceae bacterium]|jgi:hypothetical protein|nr:hypothetical protein [Isosphaeraceae bacterium]
MNRNKYWPTILVALGAGWSGDGADDQRDLREKRTRQERVRAETEDVDGRLEAMVRVLKFQGLGTSGEAKRLDEVATTLEKLDAGPMAEIVDRLGRAAAADDAGQARPEVDRARERHREVLDALRALLARRRALRDLDEAADRLERAADRQEALRRQTDPLVRAEQETASTEDPRRRDRLNAEAPSRRKRALAEAAAQEVLKKDVAATLQRLGDLRDRLPPEDRARLNRAEDAAHAVAEAIDRPAQALRADGPPLARADHWAEAADLQREATDALRALARDLRPHADPADALRDARDRLDRAMADQQAARRETADHARDGALADEGLITLADRQGRIEDQVHELRDMLRPLDESTARALAPAESATHEASEAVREAAPERALAPQDQALRAIHDAREGLDRRLTALARPREPGAGDDARRVRKALASARAAAAASEAAAEGGGDQELARSRAANDEARAALGQATARAPAGVADRLDAAAGDLDRAADRLDHGAPAAAHDSQGEAVARLDDALRALEAAQVASAAQPRPAGRTPSSKPGRIPGRATSRSPDDPVARGDGNRAPDNSTTNPAASLMAVEGPGAFLGLPPRQREAVRQALRDALPPEYAPLIRQYYINIARGRPVAPAKPKGAAGR